MNADARRRVLNRLRRAQGQLAAVIKAVEEGRPCPEVATQLAATSKALDRAGVALVSSAMQECLTGPEASSADAITPSDFERLLMMFA
jgi:DNA-binding FrmR family transcriptional regulator